MTLWSAVALAGAMALLAMTPGPGVFATVSRALASGFGPAAVVVLGIVSGDLIFLLLAIYGLAAVAQVLGELFILVKYIGGAYLIWLGYRIWHGVPQSADELDTADRRTGRARAHYLSGLMITLGNPKVIVFYLGFLPTFIDLHDLSPRDVAVAAMVVSGVLGAVLLAYAWAAGRVRHLFTSTRARRAMNRGAGGVMMLAGTVLITKP